MSINTMLSGVRQIDIQFYIVFSEVIVTDFISFMKDWKDFFIPLFAGAGSGLFSNWLKDWILQPKLKVEFSSKTEGCVRDLSLEHIPDPRKYLRAKIINTGYSEAKNVRVQLYQLYFDNVDSAVANEVFDLFWSGTDGKLERDIPPGRHLFVDIASLRLGSSSFEICGTGGIIGATVKDNLIGEGTMFIAASANNVKTVESIIRILFDRSSRLLKPIN